MGFAQFAEDGGAFAAIVDVIDDALVQVGAVGVGLVRLRLFGGVDRHGNGLLPMAGGHQVIGELVLVNIGLPTEALGRTGVQSFPFRRDQVVMNRFAGQ